MNIIVTNNPMTEAEFRGKFRVEFIESPAEVLTRVRDLVHAGHLLLTHPMPGSVKPNETPYKSVLMSETKGAVDEQSLRIIEDCMQLTRSFPQRDIPTRYHADLQMIDLMLFTGHPKTLVGYSQSTSTAEET